MDAVLPHHGAWPPQRRSTVPPNKEETHVVVSALARKARADGTVSDTPLPLFSSPCRAFSSWEHAKAKGGSRSPIFLFFLLNFFGNRKGESQLRPAGCEPCRCRFDSVLRVASTDERRLFLEEIRSPRSPFCDHAQPLVIAALEYRLLFARVSMLALSRLPRRALQVFCFGSPPGG